MIQGGIDPGRAFATQIGQIGYAMSDMSGRLGKVGTFLTGPWGIALSIGAMFAAPLVSKLFEAGEAAEQAELASSSLGDAQSIMAELFGKASSRIAEQNQLLRINAQLKAINLRTEAGEAARDAEKTFASAGTPNAVGGALRVANIALGGQGRLLDYFGIGTGSRDAMRLAARARQANAIGDDAGRLKAFQSILADSERADFTGSGTSKKAFQEAISKSFAARANSTIADLIDKSLATGSVDPLLQKPGTTKKPPKPKKVPSTTARDEFGRDAGDRVATILAQFDETPPALRQANAAVRQLDDLIDDLQRKKPPNFEATIAGAREAEGVVRASINRPFDDFVDAQEEQLAVQRLVAQGRLQEADALRAINQLQRQQGPLTDAQKARVRDITAQLHEQEKAAERLRERQRIQLNLLGDIRNTIAQTIYEGPGSVVALPERLLDAFKRGAAELITERLFGNVFEQLKDEVLGADTVEQSADRMASAVDAVTASLGNFQAALEGREPDIVVQGRREKKERLSLDGLFGKAIGGLAKGIGINDDTAKKIGSFAGKGVAGAFGGQAAAGVAGLLGIKASTSGSALGGALGAITGLPGGSIVGGLLGGLAGGLFGTPSRGGNAALTGGGIETRGSSGSLAKGAGDLGGQVQAGVEAIARQLGGALGSYDLSIGTYNGKYRVRDTAFDGRYLDFKGESAKGLHDFGDDGGAAIAYAISHAVAQGAVTGLSGAVQQALRSSPDVDKAVAEALKVQQVEELIGGIGYTLKKTFDNAAAEAKDRVRIAQTYGLDVLAVEKANAEARTKLIADTLSARVGPLQDLVASLTTGDLFEGSAAERRTALKAQIDDVLASAEAGSEGAAQQLAQLYNQLVTTSREAFGTGGSEYATDRKEALDAAGRVIQLETDRVNAAAAQQAAQTAALSEANALAAQTNGLLAQQGTTLSAILAQLGKSNAIVPDLSLVTR